MNAGETFFFRNKPEPHLWIILSDPKLDAGRVLLVNVTSYVAGHPYKETACLLNPGDHGFITKCSCINYRDALVYTDAQLTSLLSRDLIELHDPLDRNVFEKVREGASLSRKILWENLEILISQEPGV